MEKVKVVGVAFLLVGMILVSAFIGTLFLYMCWNWGLVPALRGSKMYLTEISFETAFWLSLCLSTIGGFFKTSVTVTKES